MIGILRALGFRQVRQRGSHRQFRHGDGRATTVPDHGSRDISPVLLRRIARVAGLTGRSSSPTAANDPRFVGPFETRGVRGWPWRRDEACGLTR